MCDSKFSQKGKLRVHVTWVDEGKKSFKCDMCASRFTQKGSLKAHIESIHEGKKPFKCNTCESRYSEKNPRIFISILFSSQNPKSLGW